MFNQTKVLVFFIPIAVTVSPSNPEASLVRSSPEHLAGCWTELPGKRNDGIVKLPGIPVSGLQPWFNRRHDVGSSSNAEMFPCTKTSFKSDFDGTVTNRKYPTSEANDPAEIYIIRASPIGLMQVDPNAPYPEYHQAGITNPPDMDYNTDDHTRDFLSNVGEDKSPNGSDCEKKSFRQPHRGASEIPKKNDTFGPCRKRRLEQGKLHSYSLAGCFEIDGFRNKRIQENSARNEAPKFQRNETKIYMQTQPAAGQRGIPKHNLVEKVRYNLENYEKDEISNGVQQPIHPSPNEVGKLSVTHVTKAMRPNLNYGFYYQFHADQHGKRPDFQFPGFDLRRKTIHADESKSPGVNDVINIIFIMHSDSTDYLTIRPNFQEKFKNMFWEIHSNKMYEGRRNTAGIGTNSRKIWSDSVNEIYKKKKRLVLILGQN